MKTYTLHVEYDCLLHVLILKYLTLKSSLHFHRDLLNERTSHYKTHSRSLKNDYDHMSKCAKRGMVARPNKIAPVIGQSRIDCLRWNDCFTVEKKRNVSSILTSSVNAKALKRQQLATLSDQRNITNITSYDPNEIARSNQLQTIQPVKEKNKAKPAAPPQSFLTHAKSIPTGRQLPGKSDSA